ncbi:MAG: alkaline phosphatase [Bacteroidota bacterium]|nr:alkaline phosphatase [Bacteroidota bacterium]
MKKFLALISIATVIFGCNTSSNNEENILNTEQLVIASETTVKGQRLSLIADQPIKNVIFMIGDGTGIAQLYSGQLQEVGPNGYLHAQRLPITGIVKTHAEDDLITDSASGATAYSCGIKTKNGVIAQDSDGNECVTLLELSQKAGMKTGLVATSGVTHATPASFATHIDSRNKYSEIAEQLVESEVDVILGGGLEYFLPSDSAGSNRADQLNLLSNFEEQGYTIVLNRQAMIEENSDKIVGLFSPGGLPSKNRIPSLSEMTSKAVENLSSKENGFFLMVEGSQIDWGGHANNTPYVLREVKDFDDAIGVVLSFAEQNPGTLVIITADHETGGMTINGVNRENTVVDIAWTSTGHTGTPIPLMAYGPHAVEFSGWWDNTDIGKKVADLLGFENFPLVLTEGN